MKLFNLSQNKLISKKLKHAKSLSDRSKGLIGIKKKNAYPLYFQTHFGIHTYGLKFPLTILVCDSNFTIVKIKENLKPNRFFFWNPKYSNIIELPEINSVETTRWGVSKNSKTLRIKQNFKDGDKLKIK